MASPFRRIANVGSVVMMHVSPRAAPPGAERPSLAHRARHAILENDDAGGRGQPPAFRSQADYSSTPRSAARERQPVLANMWVRWVRSVGTLMAQASAMVASLPPAASARATSVSRGVSR